MQFINTGVTRSLSDSVLLFSRAVLLTLSVCVSGKSRPCVRYEGMEGGKDTAPLILTLGTRSRSSALRSSHFTSRQKKKPLPMTQQATRAPELVWTFCLREKLLAPTGIRTRIVPAQYVVIFTALPVIRVYNTCYHVLR